MTEQCECRGTGFAPGSPSPSNAPLKLCGLCDAAERQEVGQKKTQRGQFPDSSPELWFVEAVPFTIELIRYFHGRSQFDPARAVLRVLIADLEMGECGALDLVRDVCLMTDRRKTTEMH